MKKHIKIGAALCLVLFVGSMMLALLGTPSAAATARPTAAEIPVSSLIVGSHIIALSAITDEIAAAAEASAQQYSQNKVYYKSEIDNTWYDITSSSMVHGTPVQNSVIDAIVTMTHWTKSDGKTYDLETGAVVKINEIRDLAKPTTVTQADAIGTQIEVMNNLAKNEKDDEALAKIQANLSILNDMMADIDAAKAQAMYTALKAGFAMYNGNSYDDFEAILWYKPLRTSLTPAELQQAVADKFGIKLEAIPPNADSMTRQAIEMRNSGKVMPKIMELELKVVGAAAAEAAEGEEAESMDAEELAALAAARRAELQAYYRISALLSEAEIAGAADLPGKRTAINAFDDFIIYLRGQKEKDSVVELAVAEKAQVQAIYDIACVAVTIERLNSGISRAKLNQAEDITAVLTDVMNAYQEMLGDLEEIARGEPDMVLTEMFEEQAAVMSGAVGSRNFSKAHGDLGRLALIHNCIEMNLIDPEGELDILFGAIPRSLTKINAHFKAGQGKVYETIVGIEIKSYMDAVSAGNTANALAAVQRLGISANKALLDEHGMLLDLFKERAVVESMNDMLRSGIQNLSALSKVLPGDIFQSDNYELLMNYLDDLYARLNAGELLLDDDYQRELDDLAFLEAMLQSLNNQYIDAMLAGDFDLAAQLQAEIDALLDMGVGGSEDNLDAYLGLAGQAAIIEQLLENAEGDEADRLRGELRDINSRIARLAATDPFIAAIEAAGGLGVAPIFAEGSDFITDEGLGFVEYYGLAIDPGVAGVLDLADDLQFLLDNGILDDGTAGMMAPLVERLLMLDALSSGMLDSEGEGIANASLARTILEIMVNERSKYSEDERQRLEALSGGFGGIGHQTGNMAAGSVVLGYNTLKFSVPTIKYAGEVYVPIGEAFGHFGGAMTHLSDRDRVVVQRGAALIELTAGRREVYIDDRYSELSGPVLDYNKVLYVPASFVAEQVGIAWEYEPNYDVFIFYSFDY